MKIYKYILIQLIIIGCSDVNNFNNLDSDDFDKKSERIEKLKNEIKTKSNFYDAEYELYNVNEFTQNRTFVPGASSWDYKFAIKVDKSDISNWTSEMVKVEQNQFDDSWTKEIIKQRKENWLVSSNPVFYKSKEENVIMIVYEQEGIIFKRMINN